MFVFLHLLSHGTSWRTGDYFGGDRRQGTGLGLPISSQLAELMGGSLKIANSEAGGAVVRLSLPFEHQQGRG